MVSKEYFRALYERRRSELKSMLGSKCAACGTSEELEFDHIEPHGKSFTISANLKLSMTRLKIELAKCQLLCRPCHMTKSRNDGSFLKGKPRGAEAPFAKLQKQDVIVIKRRLLAGDKVAQIARDYDVFHGAIRHIRDGRSWAHVVLDS